jgi:hypothetical protein
MTRREIRGIKRKRREIRREKEKRDEKRGAKEDIRREEKKMKR